MFKYIGIRGHRGAGKNTVAYLLGTAIEYYLDHNRSFEGFSEVYDECVNMIKCDSDFIDNISFHHVFVENFSEGPKILLSQLINVPVEDMNDDTLKDMIFINLRTFEVIRCQDRMAKWTMEKQAMTAVEFYSALSHGITFGLWDSKYIMENDVWMSLRELLIYFGKYTMQNMFGKNIWVKCLRANESERARFYADNKTIYKIFADCKFPSEISYIKDKEGFIIDVERPDNRKEATEISSEIATDNRIDHTITITTDVDGMQKDFENLVLMIV